MTHALHWVGHVVLGRTPLLSPASSTSGANDRRLERLPVANRTFDTLLVAAGRR